MPKLRAASRMVEPSGTETGFPSRRISIERRAGAGGASGTGPRGIGISAEGAAFGSFMRGDSDSVPTRVRLKQFVPVRKWKHHAWLAPFLATFGFLRSPNRAAGCESGALELPPAEPRRLGRERT